MLGRNLLEVGLKLAVVRKDIRAFQHVRNLLAPYYQDAVHLPPSPNKMEVTGLILMYLLTENLLKEFHIELEKLPHHFLNENSFINTAFELERFMMMGNYHKVGALLIRISC